MQSVATSTNSPRERWLQSGWFAAAISVACTFAATAAKADDCPPADQLRPVLTAPAATRVPRDACIAPFVGNPIPLAYFDDYSWRAFIALVWPAKSGVDGLPKRGSADTD